MLNENRFRKYLIYALGEIILVVIGILIALSINNQNQERQNRAKEKILIKGLVDDFEESKLLLQTIIAQQEVVVSSAKDLINIIENKDYTVSSDSIINILTNGGYSYYRAEAVLSTYDAIIGSGDISILQDKNLINALAKFSSKFKIGFDDNALSEEFVLMMTQSIAEFSSVLEYEGNRRVLESTYRPSEKEKTVAIQKLFNTPSFLAYLKWKTRCEANRLYWEKELLMEANTVLMYLNGNDFDFINEDYLQKFVGHYEGNNEDGRSIQINIFLDDEQLYVNAPFGKRKLIPQAIDTFYIEKPPIQFNFDFDEKGFVGLEGVLNENSIQFTKIENE